MTTLCVDAGTSMIKSVAYDDDGRELAVARTRSQVRRPAPGHAEQDMDAVWAGVAGTLREAHAHAGGRVDLIAITAQGDGCWLVDAAGSAVRPAVLWSDGRNPAPVGRWERDGTMARAFAVNGSLSFPGLPNAILPWLRTHEADVFERAHSMLTCGGWIFSRLTGEQVIDVSDASAPLLDIRGGGWSDELITLFDLDWARHLLPEVRAMDGRLGPLTAMAADALGLPEGTPVVMAPYDIAATAIGVGATAPGQACSILGTTLCTETVVDHVDTSGTPSGFTIAMGVGDRYLRAFPTLAGTEVLTWMMNTLGLSSPAELAELAQRAPAGAGGLVILPYLSPAGERAPFLDARARGTVLGLTLEHGPEHLARATFEGLSHVVYDCLLASGANLDELRVCGGGAASAFWCQLIADVTGVATQRTSDAEVGAKGALVVGRVAAGFEDDLDATAARLVAVRDRFTPNASAHDHYLEQHEQFLELRRISAPGWHLLTAEEREA